MVEWLQAPCSYPASSAEVFAGNVGGSRTHCCPLSHQNGEFTEYCMNSNGHQKAWAKRNADSYPRNICPVDRRPMVQKIMETDPLQQGQALACALKNKKKMQKRTGGDT